MIAAVRRVLGRQSAQPLPLEILESSADCIVCVDQTGMVVLANPAAARVFECAPDELVASRLRASYLRCNGMKASAGSSGFMAKSPNATPARRAASASR